MALAQRREIVLKIIVDEYIAGAVPVASKTIADNYDLKVSPATIRSEIAYLEQGGYVSRPHSSAGSVPTDKAYRYYVEAMSGDIEIPLAEQYLIYRLFQETKEEIEQLLKLATAWLARFVHNMALVTSPRPSQHRLKHLGLVALQDFVALLILVLYKAKVRQKILFFDRRISQDELTKIANKLASIYNGMSGSEILANKNKLELSREESQVTGNLVDMIATEDKLEYGKPYFEGLHLMLSQPEFSSSLKMLSVLRVLEREDWLNDIFCSELNRGKAKVIIGGETPEEALQDLSLIISQYGMPDKTSGIVGVLGPKRMDYAKAIASVNCLSSVLSKSVAEYI
jgi:heat-inducible transcriptional repressor